MSTRGAAPVLDFVDVMLTGLASDGGLYVPEAWPPLPALSAEAPYADTATEVIWPYVDGIARSELAAASVEAYATFDHPAVCPLVELAPNTWLLELFHGPTLAFKDVALQLLARLLDAELERRGERVAIVLATSGDTGSAAIEACRDRPNIDIFVFHPEGRVSEVQRRQMTTVMAPNVHNVALAGTFDDCQDMVKALFADAPFRERFRLGAANSINWGRVVPQVVYYVTSALALGATATRPVSFAVPTGNFGNVLSGWVAKEMGLPVDRLIIGSNRNDILTRVVETGTMKVTGVVPTMSPSMDIQVSSNFERLLFELNGRDGGMTAEQMALFRSRGSLSLEADQSEQLRATFDAARCDEDETLPRDRPCTRRVRRRRRSAHRGWSVCGAADAPRSRHPRRRARHRTPGEVPRCRGARDRRASAVARSARRADGPARATRLAPHRAGSGRGAHRGAAHE